MTLKLTRIGSTSAQELKVANGEVLISYSTPVAARIIKEDGAHYYMSEVHYSNTTTKHINKWLGTCKADAETMPESFFEGLIEFA